MHIYYITHKANSRLHLLRQLKRAAVSQRDMLHFYIGVIHPVLEYAVAVWHSGLIAELSDQLKTIQKRAFRIILGGSSFSNQSYESFCHNLEILPLSTRRDQLASHFFHKLLHPTSCLHLRPVARDHRGRGAGWMDVVTRPSHRRCVVAVGGLVWCCCRASECHRAPASITTRRRPSLHGWSRGR